MTRLLAAFTSPRVCLWVVSVCVRTSTVSDNSLYHILQRPYFDKTKLGLIQCNIVWCFGLHISTIHIQHHAMQPCTHHTIDRILYYILFGCMKLQIIFMQVVQYGLTTAHIIQITHTHTHIYTNSICSVVMLVVLYRIENGQCLAIAHDIRIKSIVPAYLSTFTCVHDRDTVVGNRDRQSSTINNVILFDSNGR